MNGTYGISSYESNENDKVITKIYLDCANILWLICGYWTKNYLFTPMSELEVS
jgi:hypothetical protein